MTHRLLIMGFSYHKRHAILFKVAVIHFQLSESEAVEWSGGVELSKVFGFFLNTQIISQGLFQLVFKMCNSC